MAAVLEDYTTLWAQSVGARGGIKYGSSTWRLYSSVSSVCGGSWGDLLWRQYLTTIELSVSSVCGGSWGDLLWRQYLKTIQLCELSLWWLVGGLSMAAVLEDYTALWAQFVLVGGLSMAAVLDDYAALWARLFWLVGGFTMAAVLEDYTALWAQSGLARGGIYYGGSTWWLYSSVSSVWFGSWGDLLWRQYLTTIQLCELSLVSSWGDLLWRQYLTTMQLCELSLVWFVGGFTMAAVLEDYTALWAQSGLARVGIKYDSSTWRLYSSVSSVCGGSWGD